jgi:HEAT repeat protein
MNENPYILLRKIEWTEEDGDPMAAAIAAFDPLMPEELHSLLLDDDPIIRRRGLFVFGSIGSKALVVLDAALQSIDDPDVSARANLMDGVLCFSKQLSPPQARIILRLADAPEDLVREKVVAFLGAAAQETIASAIELLDEPLRSEYRKAFAKFSAEPSQAQLLLQEGLANISVLSTFALASIQRMARKGRLTAVPEYQGDSYVGQGVVANTARLMQNAARRGVKERDN